MSRLRNAEIAARIRGLLSGQGKPNEIAVRLHVDETALRMSVDDISPYPTMDVIVAVVQEYGVDPHWLMTGEYNPGFHQRAIEAPSQEVPVVVNDIIDRIAGQPAPPNLRLLR